MKKILMLLLPLVVLSACAGGTQRDASDHNAADVRFVQQMIPHHEQAVEMSAMATGTTTDSVVVDLADRIEAAQQPEIDRMKGWLEDWGVDETDATEHGSDGHDDMAGEGMMTSAQMDELEASGGVAFARSWVAMMIEHHEGAIAMAETELAEGKNPAAQKLARQIIAAQQQEIDEMRATGF